MSSRRKFLEAAAGMAAAAGLGSWRAPGSGIGYDPGSNNASEGSENPDPAQELSGHLISSPQLGIAGYTFLHVDVDHSIAMMKRVGVDALSIKDFHLPLNSTEERIREVKGLFLAGGIRIYAAGVIYMRSNADIDNAFDYAKKLGVDLIVAAPNVELLPYVGERVKASNIRVAIHNHGPEDKLYPSPADVFSHVGRMDPRMGLCLDIGHCVRAGMDPVKAAGEYSSRLFDLHIKDLASPSKEPKPIELGRGIIDIPGLLRELKRMGYSGHCSIEHEMDMNDVLPGIAESAGYFRGVVKTLG